MICPIFRVEKSFARCWLLLVKIPSDSAMVSFPRRHGCASSMIYIRNERFLDNFRCH